MKKVLAFLFLSHGLFAQFDEKLLSNYWVKTDVFRADSSRIFDEELLNKVIHLNIKNADSVEVFAQSRVHTYPYLQISKYLTFSNSNFEITELTATSLVLVDQIEPDRTKALMLKLIPKSLFDITYKPDSYIAKNKELVYMSRTSKLEPQFIDKKMSPMDYIFERFGFPEYKKGGFVVRFIVSKTGKLSGTKIIASSNERYNDKLIKAVQSTKGKWKPALYQGQYVNTEVEYDFNLGLKVREVTSQVDSAYYAASYLNSGNELYISGSYKQAEKYFQKAIEYDPLSIDAYYQHAATCFALRKKEAGCRDLEQLMFLDQKKAKKLYDQHCRK